MMESIAKIAHLLGNAKKSGTGWKCLCPLHNDHNASLSLKEGKGGKPVFFCHAGCEQGSLVAEFRRRGWLNGADYDVRSNPSIVARFPYVDESGDLLYESIRYEPKSFKQRRPDGNGGWTWKLDGTRRVLYCLPQLLEDLAAERTIFIAEGERKVDLIRKWGLAATCNSGGAEKWLGEFSLHFKGADAVLLPDNDEPGRRHIERVGKSLTEAGASVRVLDLPDLPPKGDIIDWAAISGGTSERLLQLVEKDARKWVPWQPANGESEPFETAETRSGHLKQHAAPAIMHAKGLKTKVFQPIKYVIRGYVVEGATLLAGRPKIGKSWLALDWGLAVARSGFVFGDIHCKEGDVLYIALEDNERRLKSRIAKLLGTESEWPEKFEYALEWPRANDGGVAAIEAWIKSKETPRLIVIDVLEAFRDRARGKDNVYASDYGAIKALQVIASDMHVAILIVHHLRKAASDSDAQDKISGTLGLPAAADTFLVLDGTKAGMTLEGRGRDIMELERGVVFNRDSCRWEVLGEAADVRRSAERTKIIDVLRDASEALTPNQIAAEAGMKGPNVRYLLGALVRDGDVLKGARSKYAHPDNRKFFG